MKQIKRIFRRLKGTTRIQRVIFVIFCIIVNARLSFYLVKLDRDSIGMAVRYIVAFIEALLVVILIIMLIIYTADFFNDKAKKKRYNCYKEKLEEFTEVFFKDEFQKPDGDAGEFYWDMKHCVAPRWFAKWQEDEKIYVVLKDGDEKVRDYRIGNLSFFDLWFEFSK